MSLLQQLHSIVVERSHHAVTTRRDRAPGVMRPLSLAAITVALLSGCGANTVPAEIAAVQFKTSATQTPERSAEQRDLASLRSATARFQRFAAATEANYTLLFMNMCMVDESTANLGGMGYHYVNTALLDNHVEVESPEALLYEPGPNGQLRLVAVEYVIPKGAWTGATPPVLFGREFTLNAFDLWALHVWIWKDNPSGLYAAWNPTVSCESGPRGLKR